jgi:hypothetical protein
LTIGFVGYKGIGMHSCYEVEESASDASMPRVFHLTGVFKRVEDIFNNGTLVEQEFVK